VLAIADERGFLAPLPLAAAEPPPELAAILATWGIRTLGQLTALAKADIARRLGAAGVTLWERAAGESTRPLQPAVPPHTFAVQMDFEQEIETLEPLLFILRRFVDRLALELRSASLVAAELTLALTLSDETRHARHFRLPEPTGDPGILFRSLHTHLETLHTDSPVRGVALRIEPARRPGKQQDLFATGLRDPHGFAETLARTVAVTGSDRVGAPRIADTYRPDTFTVEPPPEVIPPPVPSAVPPLLGLPLRRFRPPLPAQVEMTARLPSYLRAENVEGEITARRGPWHGSGDWWQADLAWSRLEWDIELARGGLYRLVQTSAGWFLEGEYD
jgi:protein ImuB